MNKKISIDEKIFVAGSRGIAGSAICRMLRKSGYGKKENGGILLTPNKRELNLLDTDAVLSWFSKNKPTVVILAAAKVGGILANSSQPADFLLENIKIQTNVIQSAWRLGIKRFVFLGSNCVYPKYADQPIKEEDLLSGSLEKTNEYYSVAKIAGLKLCESLRSQYGFDAISLIPASLYGPRDNYHYSGSHVMAALIRRFNEASKSSLSEVICWGSGKPIREFMHADDLGDAVVFALENWDPSSSNSPKDNNGKELSFLNVGTGAEISIKNLTEKISTATRFKGNIRWDETKPDGTPRKQLSIEKITQLGWRAKINLNEGINKTIISFNEELNNGSLRK